MFCKHCGKELPKGTTICTSCGCYAGECTVTFIKKSQFMGFLINMTIEITGQGTSHTIEIKNGQSVPLTLPSGNYRLHISWDVYGKTYDMVLIQDKTIYVSANKYKGGIVIEEE